MFGGNNKRKRENVSSTDTMVLEEEEEMTPESVPTPMLTPPVAGAIPAAESSLLAKAMAQVAATETALKEALGSVAQSHSELQAVQMAITNKWENGAELQELLVRRESLMTLQARAEMQEKSARMAYKAAEGRLLSVQNEIERYRDTLREQSTNRSLILQRIDETRERLRVFEAELEEHDQRVARIHADLERLGGKPPEVV